MLLLWDLPYSDDNELQTITEAAKQSIQEKKAQPSQQCEI